MKKLSFRALLLCLVLLVSAFGLSACGKEKPSPEDDSETTASGVKIREVKLSGANFYDYFDTRNIPSTRPARTASSTPASSATAFRCAKATSPRTTPTTRTP